jgi:hypothetical protein
MARIAFPKHWKNHLRNDHRTPVMAFNDAAKIAHGYQACGMLRNGMSIDAIAGAMIRTCG